FVQIIDRRVVEWLGEARTMGVTDCHGQTLTPIRGAAEPATRDRPVWSRHMRQAVQPSVECRARRIASWLAIESPNSVPERRRSPLGDKGAVVFPHAPFELDETRACVEQDPEVCAEIGIIRDDATHSYRCGVDDARSFSAAPRELRVGKRTRYAQPI